MGQERGAAWLGLAIPDSTALLANPHLALTAQASGCLLALQTSWTVLVCCQRTGLGVCDLRYAASIAYLQAKHHQQLTILSAAAAAGQPCVIVAERP